MSAEGKLLHIQCDDAAKQAIVLGAQAALVLDNTSFYAESGGQVGDQGVLRTPTGLFSVTDTQRYMVLLCIGVRLLRVTQVGQPVVAEVSDRRYKMTVIILQHIYCMPHCDKSLESMLYKGSLVTPERLRFDFAHHAPLSGEQIVRIETLECAHSTSSPGSGSNNAFSEAAQGVMALFTDKYQDGKGVDHGWIFSRALWWYSRNEYRAYWIVCGG